MIRIDRGPCPPCLTRAKSEGNRYKNTQVVTALWEMQHRKCCYSELSIPKDGHGKAVEHFRPKAKFAWQRNDWKNLLLVCPQCNGKKSDLFPVMLTNKADETKVVYTKASHDAPPALLDPSDACSDPEEHLTYILDDREPLYGQIVPRNESVLGDLTIAVTGIGDAFFLRERKGRLLQVLDQTYRNILLAQRNEEEEGLSAALDTFRLYMAATSELAGLSRQYARHKRLDKRFGLAIPGPTVPG
jgi:uncharacterized protein (TIGR02646 family)